jgi:hypothetical protein
LGDIGYVSDHRLFVFLEEQLQKFEVVFFLLGNHEPYGMTFPAARASMKAFSERMERLRTMSTIGKFIYLDKVRHYERTNGIGLHAIV